MSSDDRVDNRIDKRRAREEQTPCRVRGQVLRIAPLLANHDPDLAELSGHTVIGAELAQRYGITDEDGRQPPSHREMLGAPREPSPVIVR